MPSTTSSRTCSRWPRRPGPTRRSPSARTWSTCSRCIRAEGTSEWRTCAHDEFALVIDGSVEVRLVKLDAPVASRRQAGLGPHRRRAGRPAHGAHRRRPGPHGAPARRLRLPLPRRAAVGHPPADDRRATTPSSAGPRSACPEYTKKELTMTVTETAQVQASGPNAEGYQAVHPRRLPLQPRRVLRPHHVADRQPRHVGRRLPAGPAARRGVGLLLRHRQLRRRRRHGEPLRQRRPLRRPLQRRLPQGRARPRRELRRRRSSARPSRPCSTTGRTRASTRSPARPRRASPSV